jgi:D-alanyl-D-alanine dipeptidase
MTRHIFTMLICDLLQDMRAEGLKPFIDFCKRSDEEQKRLYLQGSSKCDGIIKVSQHQRGKAVDIYLLDDKGKLVQWDHDLAAAWHRHWEDMGGEPMIEWDLGHFEIE